ncbi:MAG TPA: hypothetical protein VEK80_12685 [Kribbellaceae bacterium]|nr:hypothetical protein [Kribbellaceae bacterium]
MTLAAAADIVGLSEASLRRHYLGTPDLPRAAHYQMVRRSDAEAFARGTPIGSPRARPLTGSAGRPPAYAGCCSRARYAARRTVPGRSSRTTSTSCSRPDGHRPRGTRSMRAGSRPGPRPSCLGSHRAPSRRTRRLAGCRGCGTRPARGGSGRGTST